MLLGISRASSRRARRAPTWPIWCAGAVTRYDLPGIGALNFVLEQALGGGGMASLRNDPLGKGMAQILLAMPVRIPRRLVPAATAEGAST